MKRIKEIFVFILTLTIGVFLFLFFLKDIGFESIFEGLKMIRPLWIVIALSLFFGMFFLDAYRWGVIVKAHKFKPRFRDLLIAKFAGFAVSYLTPIFYVGGEGGRAMILKKRADIDVADGIKTIMIDKVIEAIMLCVMLLLSGILLIFKSQGFVYLFFSILMMVIGIGGITFFAWQINNDKNIFRFLIETFRLERIKFIKKKKEKICCAEDGVYLFFRQNSQVFTKTLVLSIITNLFYIIFIKFVIFALGFEISLFASLLARALAIVVTLIPIPAALGVFEGSFSYAFKLLGFGPAVGINFSLIMRVFYSFWVIIGLISLSHFGISFVRNKLKNA